MKWCCIFFVSCICRYISLEPNQTKCLQNRSNEKAGIEHVLKIVSLKTLEFSFDKRKMRHIFDGSWRGNFLNIHFTRWLTLNRSVVYWNGCMICIQMTSLGQDWLWIVTTLWLEYWAFSDSGLESLRPQCLIESVYRAVWTAHCRVCSLTTTARPSSNQSQPDARQLTAAFAAWPRLLDFRLTNHSRTLESSPPRLQPDHACPTFVEPITAGR